MSWVAVAVAGGAIVGGAMSASGAKDAAGIQGAATDKAVKENRRQFDLGRSDMEPYRRVGGAAVYRLGDLLGLDLGGRNPSRSMNSIVEELRSSGRFTRAPERDAATWELMNGPEGSQEWVNVATGQRAPGGMMAPAPGSTGGGAQRFDDAALMSEAQRIYEAQPRPSGAPGMTPQQVMEMDPGYQFRLDEGNKAIDYGLRGSRIRNSGAALKAITRYGQDYATNAFDSIYNRLAGVAGTGQTAATTGANLGANFGRTVGDLYSAGGNARGAAAIAGANAYGGALNTIGNYYGQSAMLDKLMANRGTGFGGVGAYPY